MQRWGLLAGGAAVCWTCGFTTALRFLGSNDVEPHQSEQHDHGQQGDGCGSTSGSGAGVGDTAVTVVPQPVLPCLRARRSVFPRDFAPDGSSVGRDVVQSLLAERSVDHFGRNGYGRDVLTSSESQHTVDLVINDEQ